MIKGYFSMLHVWVSVLLLVFLKNVPLTSVGPWAIPEKGQFFLSAVLFCCVGAVLSGVLGYLVDGLIDPSVTIRMPRFKEDVRRNSFVTIAILLMPFLGHFIFYFLGYDYPLDTMTAIFIGPMAYLFSYLLVRQRLKERNARADFEDMPSRELLFPGAILLLVPFCLLWVTGRFLSADRLAGIADFFRLLFYFFLFFWMASVLVKKNRGFLGVRNDGPTLIMVNPPFSGLAPGVVSFFFRDYPGIFVVLRALTPSRYRVIDYNRVAWEDRFFEAKGLVAITCFTSNSSEAYAIAKGFKARGNTVVMGGPHVTFFPDEALEFCDAVVQGQVEGVWERVVSDYERGSLEKIYKRSCDPASIAKVTEYMKKAPVEFLFGSLELTRGCKFRCHFCTSPALVPEKSVRLSVEDLVLILQRMKKRSRSFYFVDNNIYLEPARAKEFFRAMIPLKMRWGSSISIDVARDDEAIDLIKRSGCQLLGIGYEITGGSKEKSRGGKFSFADEYIALTRKLRKAGLPIKANFMFGFLPDSWRTLLEAWWFAFRLRAPMTIWSCLTPLPGAQFFFQAFSEGRVLHLNWRSYNAQALVFDHPRLGRPLLLRRLFWVIAIGFLATTSAMVQPVLVLLAFKTVWGVF